MYFVMCTLGTCGVDEEAEHDEQGKEVHEEEQKKEELDERRCLTRGDA